MASSHVRRPRIHWAVAVSENLLVVAVWVNPFLLTGLHVRSVSFFVFLFES